MAGALAAQVAESIATYAGAATETVEAIGTFVSVVATIARAYGVDQSRPLDEEVEGAQ